MSDPDPESLALIHKLHRELNFQSLRPRGRRGVQTTSSEIPSGLGGNRQKQQKQAGDKARVRASHSGSSEGISGQHDRSVLTFGAGEGSAGSPDVRRKPSHHGPGRSQAAQQQDKGRKRARTSPDTAAGQERAQQQKPPPPPPVPAEDPFKDRPPLEAAAAHASVALRTRLRELHASPQPKAATIGAGAAGTDDGGGSAAPRLAKCFLAGVRWGISLAPASLKCRADLAAALNDAFAGEILSCGRGEMLSILFVDAEGNATELPPLRGGAGVAGHHLSAAAGLGAVVAGGGAAGGAGTAGVPGAGSAGGALPGGGVSAGGTLPHVRLSRGESAGRWKALVDRAVRIYVRRG